MDAPKLKKSPPGSARWQAVRSFAFEEFAYIVLELCWRWWRFLAPSARPARFGTLRSDMASPLSLVVTIDRILLVLMVIEILHTVRVSFTEGALVSEPFLVVGLIASIRRVLVITLKSSQAQEPGKWTPDLQGLFNATIIGFVVLGGLILAMVISIYLLRRSQRIS